jgi:hypothetical protein
MAANRREPAVTETPELRPAPSGCTAFARRGRPGRMPVQHWTIAEFTAWPAIIVPMNATRASETTGRRDSRACSTGTRLNRRSAATGHHGRAHKQSHPPDGMRPSAAREARCSHLFTALSPDQSWRCQAIRQTQCKAFGPGQACRQDAFRASQPSRRAQVRVEPSRRHYRSGTPQRQRTAELRHINDQERRCCGTAAVLPAPRSALMAARAGAPPPGSFPQISQADSPCSPTLAGLSSSHPLDPLAATASMAALTGRRIRTAAPTINPAATRKDSAPTRPTAESRSHNLLMTSDPAT